jgi:hypothetical protein
MGYYFPPVPDHTRILIGVLSGPTAKSRKRRTEIRDTWLQHYSAKPSVNAFFRAYFLVGNSCDTHIQQRLVAEAIAHGDIMLMPGCRESYHAIAKKVVALFHVSGTGAAAQSEGLLWLPQSVQHVVKTDDDAFVRVDKLLDRLYQSRTGLHAPAIKKDPASASAAITGTTAPFLRPRPTLVHKLYMGNVMRGQPVVRDVSNTRYYVSPEEFALPVKKSGPDVFPPYISGSGVVMSRDVAAAIDPLSQEPGYVPFKFEDVNTGMLVARIPGGARVPLTSSSEILGWGHKGPILPKEWFMLHYVNHYGWNMRKVMEHLIHPPPLSEHPFLEKIGWDVPQGQFNLWTVQPSVAEEACSSKKGVAAGCQGWVVYKSTAYLKSSTVGAVLLKPGSGRVMFVRNPAFDWGSPDGSEGKEQRAALRDGGRPANQSCPGGSDSVTTSGHDALVTLTAGESHLDRVRDLMVHVREVQTKGHGLSVTRITQEYLFGTAVTKGKGRTDFVVLHWDMNNEDGRRHEVGEAHAWWWNGVPGLFRVTHIYRKGFVKLDFAREVLTPAIVCAYDYVFLWDSDVVLSPERFSFLGFVAQMQQHGLDLASPTLDKESFASYSMTRSRGGESGATLPPPRENWRVEVGFMVFATETFLSFRALLQRFAFKFWWIDTLPLQCILSARKVALLDGMVVHHGDTRSEVNAGEKTLKIDVPYTLREKSWRTEAIAQYGCCAYMRGAKMRYAKEEEKPAFFKCACDSGGLYC